MEYASWRALQMKLSVCRKRQCEKKNGLNSREERSTSTYKEYEGLGRRRKDTCIACLQSSLQRWTVDWATIYEQDEHRLLSSVIRPRHVALVIHRHEPFDTPYLAKQHHRHETEMYTDTRARERYIQEHTISSC